MLEIFIKKKLKSFEEKNYTVNHNEHNRRKTPTSKGGVVADLLSQLLTHQRTPLTS